MRDLTYSPVVSAATALGGKDFQRGIFEEKKQDYCRHQCPIDRCFVDCESCDMM